MKIKWALIIFLFTVFLIFMMLMFYSNPTLADDGNFEMWLINEVDTILTRRLNDTRDINTLVSIRLEELQLAWKDQCLRMSHPDMYHKFDQYIARSVEKCGRVDPQLTPFFDRFYNASYSNNDLVIFKYYKTSGTSNSVILDLLAHNKFR